MTTLARSLGPVVNKAMKRFSVPGVAIGILHDGEELRLARGITSVDFPLEVDDHTLFQIGSTTKTYTATLLMMLVEQGEVDLDAPVVEYLPSFCLPDQATTAAATVRHLVTHTGGWVGDYFDDLGRGDDALRKIVKRMAKATPQVTPLGTVWSYNNAGFYVLGRLIETVTKKTFEQAVKERLLEPLGMDRSFFFAEDVFTYKTALGHQARPDGSVTIARPWGLSRSANPAGGIVSNVIDQLRYARFHLGSGKAENGERLLQKTTLKQMRKALAPAGGMCDHVGVSWLLERVGGVQVVKHGGSINGHMSEFMLVPARQFALTVLTNGSRGHELGKVVIDWAYSELLGVKRPEHKVRPLTAKTAAAYSGRYENRTGEYVITADGDRLLLTFEPDKKLLEANPEIRNLLPPPLPVAVVGRDLGIVQGDYITGSRVDFIRGDDGAVEWLRFGGRISRRKTD